LINLAVIFPVKDFDESVTTTLNSLALQEKITLTCIAVAERNVLDKLEARHGNLRILAVERPARGVYNALNAGLDAAQALPDLDAVAFISSGAVLATPESMYTLSSLSKGETWAVGSWRQIYGSGKDRVFLPAVARSSSDGLSQVLHFSSYWPLNIEALVLGSKLAKSLRFDETKKIGADFKLFAILLSGSSRVCVSQVPHVVLPAPGLSSEQRRLGQRDVATARFEVAKSANSIVRRTVLITISMLLLMFESVLNAVESLKASKKLQ
jgi:hypothetical protein